MSFRLSYGLCFGVFLSWSIRRRSCRVLCRSSTSTSQTWAWTAPRLWVCTRCGTPRRSRISLTLIQVLTLRCTTRSTAPSSSRLTPTTSRTCAHPNTLCSTHRWRHTCMWLSLSDESLCVERASRRLCVCVSDRVHRSHPRLRLRLSSWGSAHLQRTQRVRKTFTI